MNILKTAAAALILSCCPPFSAALAGDFDDMDGAFRQNLEALRQIRRNINNRNELLWALKKPLLEKADWEIRQAEARAETFEALLNSARSAAAVIPGLVQELDAEIASIERDRKPALSEIYRDVLELHEFICDSYNRTEAGAGWCPGD